MNNVKTCIAKDEISQYGEIFANKGDELAIIEYLEDGRIWVHNEKRDIDFSANKEEITIKE